MNNKKKFWTFESQLQRAVPEFDPTLPFDHFNVKAWFYFVVLSNKTCRSNADFVPSCALMASLSQPIYSIRFLASFLSKKLYRKFLLMNCLWVSFEWRFRDFHFIHCSFTLSQEAPQKVCRECLQTIISFYKFKQTFITNSNLASGDELIDAVTEFAQKISGEIHIVYFHESLLIVPVSGIDMINKLIKAAEKEDASDGQADAFHSTQRGNNNNKNCDALNDETMPRKGDGMLHCHDAQAMSSPKVAKSIDIDYQKPSTSSASSSTVLQVGQDFNFAPSIKDTLQMLHLNMQVDSDDDAIVVDDPEPFGTSEIIKNDFTVCQDKLSLKERVRKPVIAKKNKLKFKCSLCPQKFASQVNLAFHTSTSHYSSNDNFNEKIKQGEIIEQSMNGSFVDTYKCNECSRTFKSKRGILYHVTYSACRKMLEIRQHGA